MSARVASQPHQLLHQQQQQQQQQQRQQNFLGTDSSSGFIAGPAFAQSLQQNDFHSPSVTILNDQQLHLYDSPQSFGAPQSQFPTGQHQQQQQQQHQQQQGTQQQFDQQQLILQLPVSASGTPTSIQPHQAEPYQLAQPQSQHQQQQQQLQTPYLHQPRQQDAIQQQHLHHQQLDSPLGPNHAISSAAPVSSVAIPSGVQPSLEAWATSTTNGFSAAAAQNQIDWKSSSTSQSTSLDYSNRPFNPQTDPSYSFGRSPAPPTTPTATTSTTPSMAIPSLAGSPAVFSGDYGQHQQQQQQQQKFQHNGAPLRQQVLTSSTSSPIQSGIEEQRDEAARIQKIAKDILDCREYDYGVFLPRHISQEYPDLWVAPHSNQPGSLDGIPRQLLVLPKDANFLVDVFFENACFYYPVLNRSTVELHLMEPHTAHSLFLLNIVFMAACKHLGKSTYIKRAIQFRERARELQYHIDGRVRLSRIQGALLGSQVIYGVFTVVIGYAQLCGTYIKLPTVSNIQKDSANNSTRISSDDYENNNYDNDGNETMADIAEQSRRLMAQKGVIPEAVFQQRLMSFWTIFVRDSIARLYFGWPHGIDALAITAELPTIKGCVGLGGRRKGLNGYGGRPYANGSGAGTGKRRGPEIKPVLPEKKLMKAAGKVMQQPPHKSEREAYRVSSTLSDDDDDDDDDDDGDGVKAGGSDKDDDSDLEQGDIRLFHGTPSMGRASVDATMSSATGGEKRGKWSFDGPLLPSVDGREVAPSISGLSRTFLEKQTGSGSSAGSGSGPGTGSHSSIDIKRHTERMKLLLDAEDDVTDGGTYSRILFLEEIKLWSIGRRAGLYLMGRSTSSSVSPLGAMTGSYSTTSSVHDLYGAPSISGSSSVGVEASDPFAMAINASLDASRCSERAWLEDKELQSLQAELMAWEQALSPNFKFRQDVDAPDINHKVNGKLAVLSLFYYTITIMLQSSYLPIPQYLSSSSRSTVFKSPESISQEYDDLFSRSGSVTSMGLSDDGITPTTTTTPTTATSNPRIKREGGDSEYLYPNRFAYLHNQHQRQNSSSSSAYGSVSASVISTPGGYFNTAHKICTQLSNVLYHHLELMLDSYPNWCSIQSKLNHSLVAALRVSCLNARLSSNSQAIRDEAKAGFKMGSDLFKRQALLPDPLNIRDWPAEEDVQVMLDLEEEFREMMTTQEEEERSRSHTRDQSEEAAAAAAAAAATAQMVFDEDPGDRILYIPQNPDDAASFDAAAAAAAAAVAAGEIPSSSADGGNIIAMDGSAGAAAGGIGQGGIDYGLFRAEHVFGLSEGFQFDYNINP
ncbi:hypothetical protein BGZ97_013115 [Linnemannia gamsii]|uniref:Transcription factor domain-containing protein n=1 Tax=Linnemannia gamsii TaxID=64522 RepID=A0A9P6R015_9FUNG|nr:hypothetical protein BGZ97_013115 [Linnemannia gamsii]